jgi:hypothetical protein
MARIYRPKAFDDYRLGYVVTRDDLGGDWSHKQYAQLAIQVVPIDEDPYPLKQGMPLVTFRWQANKHTLGETWLPTHVEVGARAHDPSLEVLHRGSLIAKYLIKKFGFQHMHHEADFRAHWASPGGGDGSMYSLSPRVLMNVAFKLLDWPRVIDDPRVNEFVEVATIQPQSVDGWMDNNRKYGPNVPEADHYRTITTQVYAIDKFDAEVRLEAYMMEHDPGRWENWVMAGRPVISLNERRADSSYYIPDPLHDYAILEVAPNLLDRENYVHPVYPNHMYCPHYHKIRPV